MSIYLPTKDYSAMRGPCPEGFHVPMSDERTDAFLYWSDIINNIYYLPYWFEFDDLTETVVERSWTCNYLACDWRSVSSNSSTTKVAHLVTSSGSQMHTVTAWPIDEAFHIRPFKDVPIIADSSRTLLFSSEYDDAYVYYNQSLWLISIHIDTFEEWWKWHTMMDKNLWATVVWHPWDTQSTANCGYIYQPWNNYWFDPQWTITKSNVVVDCTWYWPGNYYSNSLMRTSNWNQTNRNMRWWETWIVQVQKELKSAYIGSYECIKYKMNADSSGNLYVPVAWYSHSYGINCAYNWNVSVDWWASTNYSWTWSSWWSITLNWYTAWTNHTIKITPTTEEYWWALAYGWEGTAWRTYLTEVIYDWSYMWYWVSATSTWNNFRRSQYDWCTSLTAAPAEVLPDTVTRIGTFFRYSQYYWCTSLISAPAEVLPNSVTTIWDRFRYSQYYWCTLLTTAPAEVLPDTVTSIGAYFRNNQYNWCTLLTTISWWKDLSIGGSSYRRRQFYNCTSSKTVTVLSDVWYASDDSDTLQNSYVTTVNVPSAYLSNFTWASVQPRSSITDSKFIWY